MLEDGGVVYNAVLGMVDIVRGTNSYYKLQVLEGDRSRSYYVFRSWGRVGTTIGGTKTEVRTTFCYGIVGNNAILHALSNVSLAL